MSRQFVKGYGDGDILIRIPVTGGLFASGTTVPADGSVGYSPGCIFIDNDAAAGSTIWINEGTAASSSFAQFALTLTGLTATGAELTRVAKLSAREVAAGAASLVVTLLLHAERTILLDQATGTAVTLPAMTGSGARYRFVVTVTKSGGSDVITATGAHLFGTVFMNTDTSAVSLWTAVAATSGGSTTFTMNGTTQGGRKGDWVEIEDVATNIGIVRGSLNASGTEATPFA